MGVRQAPGARLFQLAQDRSNRDRRFAGVGGGTDAALERDRFGQDAYAGLVAAGGVKQNVKRMKKVLYKKCFII